MLSSEGSGFDRILAAFRKILKKTGNRSLVELRILPGPESGNLDAICAVTWPGGRAELLFVYKSKGSPAIIRAAASRLRVLRKANSLLGGIPVFAAPYISDEGMEVCREEGIGGIDEVGNCLVPLPGAYIEIRGRKNPRPEARPLKSTFSPKSSRVLRELLADVDRWWQVKELAVAAGISMGLVSRIKRHMLNEEWIVEKDHRIRVRSPKAVIEAWAAHYRYKRNQVSEWYASENPSDLESRIAEWCEARGVPYALALFSAASRLAPHVRMNKTFVYADIKSGVLAEALHLKPVDSGANLVHLRPHDAGVLHHCTTVDGIRVVSDVQAFLDLKSYKGRGEEAAEFLMHHILEKRWGHGRDIGDVM